VRFVVNLSTDVLRWLTTRVTAADDALRTIDGLNDKVSSFFTTEDRLPDLEVSVDDALDQVITQYSKAADGLNDITKYLASMFQTDETPRTASQLMNQLLALRTAHQELRNSQSICERLGARYRGIPTDFDPIFAAYEWATAIKDLDLPKDIETWLIGSEAL